MWVGGALLVFGALVHLGVFQWLGRLPGDIRIETERTRVYFPVVTMLLLSAFFSLVMYVIRRFF
jgi:hypothetical protein